MNTNINTDTNMQKFLRALCCTLFAVRWLWFLTVERIPKAAAIVVTWWSGIVISPLGDWARTFPRLCSILLDILPVVWKLLLWLPPVLLVINMLHRLLPRFLRIASRLVPICSRIRTLGRRETHTIIRCICPSDTAERILDLSRHSALDLSGNCTIRQDSERNIVEMTDNGRLTELVPDRWYTTTDGYKLRLLRAAI